MSNKLVKKRYLIKEAILKMNIRNFGLASLSSLIKNTELLKVLFIELVYIYIYILINTTFLLRQLFRCSAPTFHCREPLYFICLVI